MKLSLKMSWEIKEILQKDEKTLQINGFVGFYVFFAERKGNKFFLFVYSLINYQVYSDINICLSNALVIFIICQVILRRYMIFSFFDSSFIKEINNKVKHLIFVSGKKINSHYFLICKLRFRIIAETLTIIF